MNKPSHHLSESDTFGWEGGSLVPVTWHPSYQDDEPPTENRADFAEALGKFLAWLAPDADVKAAGRKAVLLAHLARQSGQATDAAVARKLNISRARLSQLRREIRAFFPSLESCNRRQIKPRANR